MTQVTEPLDPEWTPPNFSLLLLLVGVFSSVFLFVLCATESESEEQQPTTTTTIATAGKPSKGSRTSAVASKASSSRPSTLKAPTSSSHHLNACSSSSSSSAGPKASVLSLAAAQGKQAAAAAALKKTSSQLVNLGGGGSKSSAKQLSTSNHKVPAFKESVLVKSKVGGGHAQPPAPKVLEAKRLAPSCSPASNNNGAAGGKQLVSGKNFGMKTGESDAQRVVGVVGGNESSTVNSFARVEPRKTEHFEGGMQPLVSNIPAPDELIISKLPKQQQ